MCCRVAWLVLYLRLSNPIRIAESVRGLPHDIELGPAAKDDAHREFADELFIPLIDFDGRKHGLIVCAGLATGLPHCTGAGSLPCALRLSPLGKDQSKQHLLRAFSYLCDIGRLRRGLGCAELSLECQRLVITFAIRC